MSEAQKPYILVVDDEMGIPNGFRRSLQATHEIAVAFGVAEARQKIQEALQTDKIFDAVLTDCEMNDGNGADVVAAARTAGIQRIGMMSGNAGLPRVQKMIEEAKPDIVFQKPDDTGLDQMPITMQRLLGA